MKTTFENNSDVMVEGRQKVIHSVGFIAKVELVNNSNTSLTGAYQSTNNIGFLRAGFIADPRITQLQGKIQVGIALKILRSKVKSANVVAFFNPDGQTEFDFFSYPMLSHVNTPDSIIFKALAKKFKQASNCINMVGTREFGQFDKDGNLASNPTNFFKLIFIPKYHMQESSSFTVDAMQQAFEAIPVDTLL